MSVTQFELTKYLDTLLESQPIKDYCPNGLQIDSHNKTISKLISGVTASESLIDEAIKQQADAIIVHHGLFFKGEPQTITSWKFKRIEKLIKHNISLYAYHLPLDIHPVYGNNVQLADKLGLKITGKFDTLTQVALGITTELEIATTLDHFSEHIASILSRKPIIIQSEHIPNTIKTVGICTGGAQDFISQAKEARLDAYISGEISERTTHLAKELGIHYIAAGHHATERYGVESLGNHIAQYFDVNHIFIDIENPA
ncbi:Nif3-like dinuclear metal center hexameric protein [Thiotrichales bacterium 19S3-7]|nr:Nif3-like dinuclear metal center hexameric protein [Thiotrichales bacterium 19S3-7]MCF6801070.1 Nif3-like dinuclear metal center hexameric protein [Thiotrichales bacterium 19S3-11]